MNDPLHDPQHGPRLATAWAGFLHRWEWDWFATMTFRGHPHPEKADKSWRLWCSKLNRELFGPRWAKRGGGVRWVRATEPQRRGAIHFHALLGADGLREQPRLYWMDAWNEIAGFARIEEPKVQHAVDAYCSKYVAKEGQIDLSDSLRREHQLRFRLSGSRGS